MKMLMIIPITLMIMGLSLPLMRVIIMRGDLWRLNFRGNHLPVGYGFLITLTAVPAYGIGHYIGIMPKGCLPYCITILVFGIIGLIDDRYGSRNASGFKGHFSQMLHGRITTGALKAMVGGIASLILGFYIADFKIASGILNGLLIALSANMLNLLDLRPGRAISCFWLGLVVLFAFVHSLSLLGKLLPVIVPSIWVTYMDRKALAMMGDAGSNTLGAVLGLSYSMVLSFEWKILLIVLLLLAHLYSEKHSITELIERSPILKRIDRLLGVR